MKNPNQNETTLQLKYALTSAELAMLERIRQHIAAALKPGTLPSYREAIAFAINEADSSISRKASSTADTSNLVVQSFFREMHNALPERAADILINTMVKGRAIEIADAIVAKTGGKS